MHLPKIKEIRVEPCLDTVSVLDERFRHVCPIAILKTGGNVGTHRTSIVGTNPYLIFRGKGNRCVIETARGCEEFHGDPFSLLQEVFDHYRGLPFLHELSFCGGAIGAFAYDLKDTIENLESHARDDLLLPDIVFLFFRDYLVIDEFGGEASRISIVLDEVDAVRDISKMSRSEIPPSTEHLHRAQGALQTGSFSPISNFTHDAYLHAVRKVIGLIHEGDIYQANISQRFKVDFVGDPFSLFAAVGSLNPAPMMAYLRLPQFTLISTSPERFLKRRRNVVEAMPIKGTRPRGKTSEEDAQLKGELIASEKDAAELAMIVDLMRNDLGKFALPGSVVVSDSRRVETYTNVFHLVATITAEVSSETAALKIIKAAFPGGSITGCPKVRAMQVIEEIEPVKRSFYCGSIGYIGFDGDFDFNIAIRTFIATHGKLFFNLGGGIVADSDPQMEYEETLHKGATMFDLIRREIL